MRDDLIQTNPTVDGNHEPRMVNVEECRLDALLMALDDDTRGLDGHEPRSVEVEECRVDALLYKLEVEISWERDSRRVALSESPTRFRMRRLCDDFGVPFVNELRQGGVA